MSYTQFREDMTCALYQEQMHEGSEGFLTFRELAGDYDIEWREGWLLDLQKSLLSEGFLRGPQNSSNDDMAIGVLIGKGLQYIEEKYGTLDGVPTMVVKRVHEHLLVAEDLVTDSPELGRPTLHSIDSSSWTGLPKSGRLTEQSVIILKKALMAVDKAVDQSTASNEERAAARAYVIAIRALSDAPDPPADLIWALVNRANSIAGKAAFFVSVIGLFV